MGWMSVPSVPVPEMGVQATLKAISMHVGLPISVFLVFTHTLAIGFGVLLPRAGYNTQHVVIAPVYSCSKWGHIATIIKVVLGVWSLMGSFAVGLLMKHRQILMENHDLKRELARRKSFLGRLRLGFGCSSTNHHLQTKS